MSICQERQSMNQDECTFSSITLIIYLSDVLNSISDRKSTISHNKTLPVSVLCFYDKTFYFHQISVI